MYTPDGRIGYRDRCLQIHYFDGQRWQSWRRQEVDRSSRPYLDGPAFFDRAGNFAVDIEGTTWEYLVQGGWHSTSFEPGPTDDRNLQSPQPLPPPPGCEFGSPESIAQDRVGTYWMTYRGQFYHAITGLCLPQSSTEAHQPFIDGRTVKAVFIDPQGNAFLETYLHSNQNIGEYVIVNARQPLPQTRLHASVDNVGAVKLDFESTVKGKAWFTWRADNDVWAPPAQVGEATLTGLADGKHRIEARAIDERLRIDPTPAVVEVEIHADNQNQIAALIEHLKDQDYSVRDAAVAGLVRQPALALPLLQSAREKAGPDERWWIDAALQQIKERLGASPKP
jgi:hypothetical protein